MRLKDKLAGCSHIEGVVRKATSNDPNPPKREALSEMKAVTCMCHVISSFPTTCMADQLLFWKKRLKNLIVILAVKSDQAELVMLMESLLQRYREDKAVWRHQYKALIAHEYLLRHGSAKFVEACNLLVRSVDRQCRGLVRGRTSSMHLYDSSCKPKC
jgi:hypothetical protein